MWRYVHDFAALISRFLVDADCLHGSRGPAHRIAFTRKGTIEPSWRICQLRVQKVNNADLVLSCIGAQWIPRSRSFANSVRVVPRFRISGNTHSTIFGIILFRWRSFPAGICVTGSKPYETPTVVQTSIWWSKLRQRCYMICLLSTGPIASLHFTSSDQI